MTPASKVHCVRIFPSIGIARVGNSTDPQGWYYGPEVPGRFDDPQGGFKDPHGAIKRQAARFRVYAFDVDGNVLCEANQATGFEIKWTVEVANQKAAWYTFMGSMDAGAFQPGYTTLRNPTVQADQPPEKRSKLIVSSGVKTIQGANAQPLQLGGQFWGSQKKPVDIYLGEVSTDEKGHLVFKAGHGSSRSIADLHQPYPLILNDFDSPDWIDDTCDGWIQAEVRHLGGPPLKTPNKARVIGTTPKFANGIYAPTSLYDLMEEVYEQPKRTKEGNSYKVDEVSWYEDIWPLLQRPPLLSWVNEQANHGHGPNGPGNFFDKKWQEVLSDPSPASEPIRKNILGRMRLPTTNEKYDVARKGQSYPYFMPWLSGDGGRTTAGDAATFASVTELQYDRLVKWSKGEFKVAKTPPSSLPDDIEKLPLFMQPGALTKASLEATIGAPLYPGIEMSWNAEQQATYDLSVPFTIRDDALPGDLTKYLSLPWQSDFYMCRSYWWPSARPDTIVTEAAYKTALKSIKPGEDIGKQLNDRVPWERGIHQNYTDEYGSQPLFANTDMAQRWHKLGFIVQRGPEPIFVEVERNLPSNATIVPSTPHSLHRHGGITLPLPHSSEVPIKTIASLREHLQTAMQVELYSIPLYLFGMYTVKTPQKYDNDPRYYDPIVGLVRSVLAEEMLHLSLAGNILRAVGGTPKLYDPKVIPTYPSTMPGRIPPLKLNLRVMTPENVQTFIDFETPEAKGAKPEPGKYHTLGQFYDAIKQGLRYLNGRPEKLFHPELARYQFAPGVGYQPTIRDAGGSVVVVDLPSALLATKIIVDQGEGNPGPYDDLDKLEEDHYDKFRDLQAGKFGSWECYPVRSNPVTSDYLHKDRDERLYHVSLTFDAAYCFLLLTIEKLWEISVEDDRHKLVLGNLYGVMMGVLAPLARFLVQQPIGKTKENAAPAFNWYQYKPGSALEQLQHEMQNAINAYVSQTAETPDQVAVIDYGGQLNLLLPIQASIGNLLDLDKLTKFDKSTVTKPQPGALAGGAKGFARGY